MEKTFPVNPININSKYFTGWALDYHTISSKYDRAGRFYVTDRTSLGEALYKFKYKKRFWVADKIARTAAGFLNDRGIADKIGIIIIIPPAGFRLFYQPVRKPGKKIGKILGKPVEYRILKRTKKTPPLKSIEDKIERAEIIKGLFSIKTDKLSAKKTVLLFDDLYRSGATLREAARALTENGGVSKIFVLTITRTRVRR